MSLVTQIPITDYSYYSHYNYCYYYYYYYPTEFTLISFTLRLLAFPSIHLIAALKLQPVTSLTPGGTIVPV